jgi:hypothetical protein
MKRTRLSVALAAALVSAMACQKDLTSLNNNPNSPTSAPATTLFTNAVTTTIGRFNGSFQTLSMTELFAQHIAGAVRRIAVVRTEVIDGLFSGAYTAG